MSCWAVARYAEGMEAQVNPHRTAEDHQSGQDTDSDHSVGMKDQDREIEFGRVGERRQVVADTRLVLAAERRVVGG